MNGDNQFLGIIQKGQFQLLIPKSTSDGPVRLTTIHMQEARSPESGELDLLQYEASAIMVRGYSGGEWIYSVEVVDQAGPILTAVVRQVFGEASEPS